MYRFYPTTENRKREMQFLKTLFLEINERCNILLVIFNIIFYVIFILGVYKNSDKTMLTGPALA